MDSLMLTRLGRPQMILLKVFSTLCFQLDIDTVGLPTSPILSQFPSGIR